MRQAYVAARSKPQILARYEDSRLLGSDLEKIWSIAGELHRSNWIARALEHCDVTYAQAPMPVGGDADARKFFLDWWDHADLRGGSLTSIHSMIISGQVKVGDILAVFGANPNARSLVKARIQLIDGTRVRTPDSFVGGKSPAGETVVHGVQYDSNGAEAGYWVCGVKDGLYQTATEKDFTFYPLEDKATGRPVAKLLRRPDALSPSSSRGLPAITHIVPEIEDLGDLGAAAVRGAYNKSLLSVMLQTSDPAKIREAVGVRVDENNNVVQSEFEGSIEDGEVLTVPPGTVPVPISHSGDSEVVSIMGERLRHISGALGRPLELLLSNFKDINFSSSKNSFDKYARLLQLWMDENCVFYTEVYKWVVSEAFLRSGKVPTEEQLSVTWSPVTPPDPDPQKSANAENTRLADGTELRSSILARRGVDYKEWLERRAAEIKLEITILGAPLEAVTRQLVAPDAGNSTGV